MSKLNVHQTSNEPFTCHAVFSADNYCKQFGPSSGPATCPDLDLNCLTVWWYSRERIFEIGR